MGSEERKKQLSIWCFKLLSSPLYNQLQGHCVRKHWWRDAAPDWRQREGTMGSCNNGTGWNKPWCMWPSTSPSVHTLPMWNHLMHVLLLSVVNQNWGRGSSLLQSPPTTRSWCMLGRALIKTWEKKVLDLWGVLAECENGLKAFCVAWSGEMHVRGWCLWGCRNWAGDVSVGGMEGKKGKGMWGMS